MSDQFSSIPRVRADKGKAQWRYGTYLKSETDEEQHVTTHIFQIPYIMPGTIIFVHGVNSDGEWYRDAAEQFASGLNKRLGRECLEKLVGDPSRPHRFSRHRVDGKPYNSPVIPFYWGYKLQSGDEKRYPGLYHEADGAWGGGPFQNGTCSLTQFWQDGFKRKVLAGLLDLQRLNPEIDRQLQDAPPRAYYVHAAKRLANLVDTIREDFPNEPLNIVAHSQGTMIALCATLYVQRRPPDTLILNSSPYSFDVKITDWLMAAAGWSQVQSQEARFLTFQAVARKIKRAADEYKDDEENATRCGHQCRDGEMTLIAHYEPHHSEREKQIGAAKVNDDNQAWYECPHSSRDNRGKVFVNFNPNDRVIGVSAVEGIGWRGIPERILGENWNRLPNVYQRVFARNSGGTGVPMVGAKTNYWFRYFYEQLGVREDVQSGDGAKVRSSDGLVVQTENSYIKTFDGKPQYEFWNPPPKKVAGIFDVQSMPKNTDRVWINAPIVPNCHQHM